MSLLHSKITELQQTRLLDEVGFDSQHFVVTVIIRYYRSTALLLGFFDIKRFRENLSGVLDILDRLAGISNQPI
jgi:hypothetical protein